MHQRTLIPPKLEDLSSIATYPLIKTITKQIYEQGGRVFLVGGAVRDLILGVPLYDLDIEVHGLSLEQLTQILKTSGHVNPVGKSFGVLKLEGTPIDWSLPRTDKPGRKPEVAVDPSMGIYEALRRRDLTINAMAIELENHHFVDPFGGLNDLQNKVLRSPDITFFSEDPLRFYRVMQFIGRFEMQPNELLNTTCKHMSLANISRERIEAEFEKLFLKSRQPSLGIRWLSQIGRLHEILPELDQTIKIKQSPEWHPEGNVFEHSMQSLDAAASLSVDTTNEKLTLLYAALCHDLGKVSTTKLVKGVYKSHGHAEAGVPVARSLLRRITHKTKILHAVTTLIRYHMEPSQFIIANASPSAYRRLAIKIGKYTNLRMLALVALADFRGRNPEGHKPLTTTPPFFEAFLGKAAEAQTLTTVVKPVLQGRDIIDIVKPGTTMGDLLKYAYELQLEEGIKDKEVLRKKVIEKLKK